MNQKYFYLLILFILLGISSAANGQGCVAIRHFSTCNGNNLSSNILQTGNWQVSMNYRYFKSFRHFRGTHQEPDRITNNTEVVNHSSNWDFGIGYGISDRWYASLTLPYVINARSSLYEHGRSERHSTYSRGIADVRFGTGVWLLNPAKNSRGNIALGLGVKMPTGNFNATDIFYNTGPFGSPQMRPVDQSIQPGDGGWGVTLDFQFYTELTSGLYLYGGGFYLINPREMNGVHTFRDSLSPILANEAIMSVPDQYSLRAGLTYALPIESLGLSLGMRYEGVPVKDLVGGSEGFRRPGQVASLEPGISYMHNNLSLFLSVPVALYRNRPQSVTDLATEIATGNPRNGDAAFADYLINIGVSFRLNGMSSQNMLSH